MLHPGAFCSGACEVPLRYIFCGLVLGRLTVTSFNRVCPSVRRCVLLASRAPRTKNPEKLSAACNCVLRANGGDGSDGRASAWALFGLTTCSLWNLQLGGRRAPVISGTFGKVKISLSLSKFIPGVLLQDLICSEFRNGADPLSHRKLHHKVYFFYLAIP